MLKEKLASIRINPEAFDKQKTSLILTTILGGIGLSTLVALDALGVVRETDTTEAPSNS